MNVLHKLVATPTGKRSAILRPYTDATVVKGVAAPFEYAEKYDLSVMYSVSFATPPDRVDAALQLALRQAQHAFYGDIIRELHEIALVAHGEGSREAVAKISELISELEEMPG